METTPSVNQSARIIRVGVLFAAFPAANLAPYKYFVLLLNRLQKSCEFELFDTNNSDPFVSFLGASSAIDASAARAGLAAFGDRTRAEIVQAIKNHDLA